MVLPTTADPDTSTSSADITGTSFEEKRIAQLAKQLLGGRLFIGEFREKLYVENLRTYRDVIAIPSNEIEIIRALQDVKRHIRKYYPSDNWIGISEPTTVGLPPTYCIWVTLPEETQFGNYWFKLRGVKVRDNEIIPVVKVTRKVEDSRPEVTARAVRPETELLEDWTEYTKETLEKASHDLGQNLSYFFKNVTTPQNIKEMIKFFSVIFVALITGSYELLRFLSEFLLKFIYAASHFTKAATPVFQMLFNCVENLFKMLCMLVAYLFRGQPAQNRMSYNSYPRYSEQYVEYKPNLRALQYPSRSVPRFTELH